MITPVVTIEQLRKEKEEETDWEVNPIKRAIQHLLSGPLNNDHYRKLSAGEVLAITSEEFKYISEPRFKTITARLLRKIKACKTSSEAVLILGDYLLVDS